MTYHPEYEIGPKSPGVWKEVRRLEAENASLREEAEDISAAVMFLEAENARLHRAGREVVRLGDEFGDVNFGDFPDGWWKAFEDLRNALKETT